MKIFKEILAFFFIKKGYWSCVFILLMLIISSLVSQGKSSEELFVLAKNGENFLENLYYFLGIMKLIWEIIPFGNQASWTGIIIGFILLFFITYVHLKLQKNIIPKLLTSEPNIYMKEVVGREEELKKIRKKLKKEDKIVLVQGMSGIGKTIFSKYFFEKEKWKYGYIAYIEQAGEGDKKDYLKYFFVSNKILHDNLQLNIEQLDENTAFNMIINKMSKQKKLFRKNLLVIDNINADLTDFKFPKNWKILLTSREKISGFKTTKLDKLKKADARKLFCKYYKIEQIKEQELNNFLELIDRHTLSIKLLAKTAQVGKMKFNNLVKNLKKDNLSSRKIKIKINDYSKKKITYQQCLNFAFNLKGLNRKEKILLLNFSFLPAKFIEYETLKELMQINKKKDDDFHNALDALNKRGWIEEVMQKSKYYYKCHQVTQETIRPKIKFTFKDIKDLANGINKKLEINIHGIYKTDLIEYGEFFLKKINKKEIIENEENEEISSMFYFLAKIYLDLGKYNIGIKFSKKSIDIDKKTIGKEHADFAARLNNLAGLY